MTDTKEQKSISSIFLRSMLLVTVVSIVLIGCLWTWQQYQAFRQESKDLRNMMMASYKEVLKTQVKKSVEYIEYNKSLTKKKLKTSIRDRVMLAHTMATRLHEKWGEHKSREEIQATIKDSLGAMQVNRSPGYFFILDMDGVNQFKGGHPRFKGLDPGHVQDAQTTAIVQSLISLAKGRQEGFHEYAWPKPGMDKGFFDKIAFVKFFEPYRWIIGTGEYLNDFESDVKTETLNYLETCRFGKDGYIFVTQWDGLDLIGPARGKNMLGARDVNGVKIVQEFISLAKSGGGFLKYVMPKFKGKKPDPKLSYVQGIKDWQWYVGAGMYIDDIETAIQAKQSEMTKKIINSLFQIIMVLLSLITAAYFYARKMSDDTQKSFDLFTRFFKKGARDSAVIDPGIMKYKEFETLARSTNDMIEARKKIQTEQIESEKKYRLIVENINDMIVKLDRHKKLIFASPNYCEIFDRNKEDILHQPILSIISERNRRGVEKSLNKLDSPPYTSYHENNSRTCHGRRWFAWSSRTIRDDDGRPIEYLSVGRDITEKKQAEDASKENQAWLQNILDSIQAGVIVIDPKTHKIIELNRAALEMLGTKKDQIINTVCHNHICPNEVGMCPVTDLGMSIDQSDRELITSDGTRIPILKTVNPAVINQKTYLIESFLDMRDKKHLEALLIQAQKMEAIGTLAGGIAHDFNNILSGIFGYAQLLDMDIGEQEKAKKHLGRIVKGAQRASELVQQILTFSRQTDHQTLPTTVFVILKEALDLIRSSIPSSIEIKRNIVSKARIMADPTQIHQVIINLCTNAYQSMGKTGGILTINLHEAEIADPPPGTSAGKYLKLEISDTGHGMDEKTTSRIFDPYFTTKKTGKGTGLGLSTVNGIVQKHNGFIRVLSKAGQGSSFQVYLPVFNGERSQKPSKKQNIATGSGTVMVVDDETELLNTLNLLLVRIGYTVETFTNGESALNVFKKTPDIFDLVITDMTMPQMTGDKLSREILKIRPDIPIVICSGYHETFTEKEALKSGIKKFIRKPFRAVEFSKIIQDLIGSS